MSNTRDLSKFGWRELAIAGKLLTIFTRDATDNSSLEDGVAVEFNPNSGKVVLVDDIFNVAMVFGDNLEDFISCHECGYEEIKPNFLENSQDDCCKSYFKDRYHD